MQIWITGSLSSDRTSFTRPFGFSRFGGRNRHLASHHIYVVDNWLFADVVCVKSVVADLCGFIPTGLEWLHRAEDIDNELPKKLMLECLQPGGRRPTRSAPIPLKNC